MGSDVGQIFPTASLHREYSISYALVCEKVLSTILMFSLENLDWFKTVVSLLGCSLSVSVCEIRIHLSKKVFFSVITCVPKFKTVVTNIGHKL